MEYFAFFACKVLVLQVKRPKVTFFQNNTGFIDSNTRVSTINWPYTVHLLVLGSLTASRTHLGELKVTFLCCTQALVSNQSYSD